VTDQDEQAQEDLQLLRRARRGEWDAFEALVNRLEPQIYNVAYRIVQQRQDAEDAVQQTFLSVMENMDGFREQSSVATWIRRIATNHALVMLRKRRVRRTVPLNGGGQDDDTAGLPHPDFIAQWQDSPPELAQRAEVKQLLETALAELDEKYRLVFVLRDVEEFSTREAAELLSISEANVKVRLLRARLQLRERLTRQLGDESSRVTPEHNHEVPP
jgi:RNA polymerase sigma-70 factor, ECF subfamily